MKIKAGFTLIEILTAVAIIALLSALIVGMAEHAQRSSARKKAEAQIATLEGFISDYRSERGVIPAGSSQAEDATALKKALKDASHSLSDFSDPWKDDYQYWRVSTDSRNVYYLWSFGGDDTKTNNILWIGKFPPPPYPPQP